MRFGLRSQFILLSCFLALLPWLGYEYVWEMEKYLRQGQEKTLVGTTRALATALHERPKLFDEQASFLQQVVKGRDLYAYNLPNRIQLDGKLHDWKTYRPLFWHYDKSYLTPINSAHQESDLSFSHMVGKYQNYLYAVFKVKDNILKYRGANSLSITRNDHLKIALKSPEGSLLNYIIAPKNDGWITAYDESNLTPIARIQGHFSRTDFGYNIEIRMPLNMIGNKLGFAIVDIDNIDTPVKTISTSNLQDLTQLGSVLLPSPEIERIIKGMGHSGSRIWVVDNHHRVLAQSGKIQDADGVWSKSLNDDPNKISKWRQFETQYLHPLYYKILTKPPADFLDTLFDVTSLQGKHIVAALKGKPESSWRLTPDKKALILSAAYPIWIDDKVMGAVIAEETTNGVRTLRNKALEKLFTVILTVMLIGTLILFFFASRISSRIRTLRDAAEAAIDPQGRILGIIKSSKAKDEIGDLSRSFANIVGRLGGYTHYLENMSSRLSHELRTPVAVVRSSLESLQLQNLDTESQKYIERATEGVNRLNKIITTMSEATRLEQSIQSAEAEGFDLTKVVSGCMQGYQMAYAEKTFELNLNVEPNLMQGVPEFIAQLLDKLIANAVEFSSENTEISVLYTINNQSAEISVSNKGPSLPVDIGEHIFDSMVSVRSQSLQKKPHLGLGLYIARLVADYHNGKLTANNLSDGSGVVFKLVLPIKI
ncbi:proteobacterial dedicated sortase system histidine kinase [Pseudoalteromonas denitrificans]|uniref:histidine kinase n=1 Tax=Pseudoalteromonas denitrificans DSM 6059 TaxID=1123010 RepID=A0A1I1LIX5_9GAMM|nr:proteobacterial dedicated sortase system histidine kinase [Pseudoalteromonas denitrificans]SFC69440.1 dedicated sortase system histidine kinase [Pseudoalteromonas denitrificans DSM 6059]